MSRGERQRVAVAIGRGELRLAALLVVTGGIVATVTGWLVNHRPVIDVIRS